MHLIADQFRDLAGQYADAEGFDDEPNDLLCKQIQHDWGLFDDRFSTTESFADFISELLKSGLDNDEAIAERDARTLVKPIEPSLLYSFQEALGDSLFRGNFWERFALPGDPPVSWYDAFLEDMVKTLSREQPLFRARVWDRNIRQERYGREQMDTPPLENVSPGRSNRKCQRTLYCAGDRETCIAEVRPFKGAGVAVSEIALSRDVSELYYAPTQSLCDLLRQAGYDGIRYRSSLHEGGVNIALFDPELGTPSEPEYYWIDEITVKFSDYESYESEHPYLYEYRRSKP